MWLGLAQFGLSLAQLAAWSQVTAALITTKGIKRLYQIEGIMYGLDYIQILNDQFLRSLKDLKLRCTEQSGIIFQQNNNPKHWFKVAKEWVLGQKCQVFAMDTIKS